MFSERQKGGILPQFQSENLKEFYCDIAHDVDLTSGAIRPSNSYLSIMSSRGDKMSYQRGRLIFSNNEDDVHTTSNSATYCFSNGQCFVDRGVSDVSTPSELHTTFPSVTSLTYELQDPNEEEETNCSEVRAYRIRYMSEYGELSDVLYVGEITTHKNPTINWTVEGTPDLGYWYIERSSAPYMQITKHTSQIYPDNFFVVGRVSTYVNEFIDNKGSGELLDTLPTYQDCFHINELTTDLGCVTEFGEMVVCERGSDRLYVSYPNKTYLFPLYNVVETGAPIKAITPIPKGVVVFHDHGIGVLNLEGGRSELQPTSYYTYFKTSVDLTVTNPKTISTRNNTIYFMSDLGLVMYPMTASINPSPKVVTYDVMADDIKDMNVDNMKGQCFEDGYYLTDGDTSYLITELDGLYINSGQPVIRTSSVKETNVTKYKDGQLAYVNENRVKLTKFRKSNVDPKSDIHVKIYGIDDRGDNLVYERDVNHSNSFAVKNGFRYHKYAIELSFGDTSIYRTKVHITSGIKSFGRCKIVRDSLADVLTITEISIASRVHELTLLKGT